ncbi:hypothetical protein ACFQY7_33080 [Actinomadura luteofluorescens]|uniref:hypothetical protein n=1 Tax=Actinomadura luteofluorescens TaxID=46163 RepID=UPI0036252D7B
MASFLSVDLRPTDEGRPPGSTPAAKNSSEFAEAARQIAALGLGGRERQRLLVRRSGLGGAAVAAEQVGAGRGQEVVPGEPPGRRELVDEGEAAAAPSAIATATARLRSTTGDGASRASSPYSAAICGQSVAAAPGAVAWQAAMAACTW